mgnify:CR=1 FL=1
MEYLYPGGLAKAITFSYDDGQVYDRRLIEIFNQAGFKGTFHLNSGNLDKDGYVQKAELPTLYAEHEIACHGVTHRHPRQMNQTEWLREVWQDRLTLEELTGGMKIVLRLFDHAKGILGVEDNKPDCIQKLKELTKDEERIEVMPLKTKYPQGGERQLIYATTGRAINSKMLPADAGCIVDNVETLVAINRAVKEGKPVMDRIFTVTGDAVANPGNFEYCIGMSYAEILEEAGGFKEDPEKMISGGPMMGFAVFSLEIPTTKTSSSLLCFKKDDVSASEVTACINCGRCVSVCPEQIVPSRLAKMSQFHDSESFEKWNGMECIECGSCSYICPAKRPLAQYIKTMKKQILAERRKKQ